MPSLGIRRIGYSPKGPQKIGTASLRFTVVKSLRLVGSETQFIYTLNNRFLGVRLVLSKLMVVRIRMSVY